VVLLAARPVSPYVTAAILVRGLPDAMRGDRELNALTYTQQAKLVGVGSDTLMRLDAGSNPTQSTVLSCLDYLGAQVSNNGS
jgi:DNA-binding phage protein